MTQRYSTHKPEIDCSSRIRWLPYRDASVGWTKLQARRLCAFHFGSTFVGSIAAVSYCCTTSLHESITPTRTEGTQTKLHLSPSTKTVHEPQVEARLTCIPHQAQSAAAPLHTKREPCTTALQPKAQRYRIHRFIRLAWRQHCRYPPHHHRRW